MGDNSVYFVVIGDRYNRRQHFFSGHIWGDGGGRDTSIDMVVMSGENKKSQLYYSADEW